MHIFGFRDQLLNRRVAPIDKWPLKDKTAVVAAAFVAVVEEPKCYGVVLVVAGSESGCFAQVPIELTRLVYDS